MPDINCGNRSSTGSLTTSARARAEAKILEDMKDGTLDSNTVVWNAGRVAKLLLGSTNNCFDGISDAQMKAYLAEYADCDDGGNGKVVSGIDIMDFGQFVMNEEGCTDAIQAFDQSVQIPGVSNPTNGSTGANGGTAANGATGANDGTAANGATGANDGTAANGSTGATQSPVPGLTDEQFVSIVDNDQIRAAVEALQDDLTLCQLQPLLDKHQLGITLDDATFDALKPELLKATTEFEVDEQKANELAQNKDVVKGLITQLVQDNADLDLTSFKARRLLTDLAKQHGVIDANQAGYISEESMEVISKHIEQNPDMKLVLDEALDLHCGNVPSPGGNNPALTAVQSETVSWFMDSGADVGALGKLLANGDIDLDSPAAEQALKDAYANTPHPPSGAKEQATPEVLAELKAQLIAKYGGDKDITAAEVEEALVNIEDPTQPNYLTDGLSEHFGAKGNTEIDFSDQAVKDGIKAAYKAEHGIELNDVDAAIAELKQAYGITGDKMTKAEWDAIEANLVGGQPGGSAQPKTLRHFMESDALTEAMKNHFDAKGNNTPIDLDDPNVKQAVIDLASTEGIENFKYAEFVEAAKDRFAKNAVNNSDNLIDYTEFNNARIFDLFMEESELQDAVNDHFANKTGDIVLMDPDVQQAMTDIWNRGYSGSSAFSRAKQFANRVDLDRNAKISQQEWQSYLDVVS
jgi:hypothetical protein